MPFALMGSRWEVLILNVRVFRSISTQAKSVYQISIGSPKGCSQSAAGCDFFLGINTNSENSNYLDFMLEGKAKGWVAVGFSKTPNMVCRLHLSLKVIMQNTWTLNLQPTADVLGCNVYSDGSAAAIDTWNPSGTKTNVLDKDQVSSLKYMWLTTQAHNVIPLTVRYLSTFYANCKWESELHVSVKLAYNVI